MRARLAVWPQHLGRRQQTCTITACRAAIVVLSGKKSQRVARLEAWLPDEEQNRMLQDLLLVMYFHERERELQSPILWTTSMHHKPRGGIAWCHPNCKGRSTTTAMSVQVDRAEIAKDLQLVVRELFLLGEDNNRAGEADAVAMGMRWWPMQELHAP